MILSIPGTLVIKVIHGRNGEFRVGHLHTEIGEFAVKDRVLDQYEEGSYEGVFGIRQIYSSSYNTSSRIVIETRAVLADIALQNVDMEASKDYESLEQDPLEEEQGPSVLLQSDSEISSEVDSKVSKTVAMGDDDSDAELFALLWPLGETVKLDPTVDRALFRQQRDRLKVLGYHFQPVGQLWHRGGDHAEN